MADKYKDYSIQADKLRMYSMGKKGEIAELTYNAALTIDVLIGRVKLCEKTFEENVIQEKKIYQSGFEAGKKAFEDETPCYLCKYNPPSSTDGKPCCMCPAEGSGEE